MAERKRKLMAALKAAAMVAGLWAAVPVFFGLVLAVGWLDQHHGDAVPAGCFVVVAVGFSLGAWIGFYCMVRGRSGTGGEG